MPTFYELWQAAVAEEFRLRHLAWKDMNCNYCSTKAILPHNYKVVGYCDDCRQTICAACVSDESPHHHNSCLPSEDNRKWDDFRKDR